MPKQSNLAENRQKFIIFPFSFLFPFKIALQISPEQLFKYNFLLILYWQT